MSSGGLLVGSSGDLALTDPSQLESIRNIARTRLKAAANGMKLYPGIGADLVALQGSTVDAELQVTAQRQTQAALSKSFLPKGSFQVETLAYGQVLQILVYLNQILITQATLTQANDSVHLQVQ